ncbi:hypothetical protein ISS42_00980 [Candidatus Shapirobacteria bacterium]|nr:hypothetical protein [Candidatus Shapirobacteria bacterium]
MSLFIPAEVITDEGKVFPFSGTIKQEAKRLIGENSLAAHRTLMIYELLELLVIDGRLDRSVISGDVCCLDVGSSAPEAVVFHQLKSRSLTVAEGFFGGKPHTLNQLPGVKFIPKNPTQALASLGKDKFDLITMFNAYTDDVTSKEKRTILLRAITDALKPGGHFIITGDMSKLGLQVIQNLETEIRHDKTAPFLNITLPGNTQEPMSGRGWVIRSILMENTLRFDFDKLRANPHDWAHDVLILVAKKSE